jgi:hypothetical protein
MYALVLAVFFVTPFVLHYSTFDSARASSASALITGLVFGMLAAWRIQWEIGLLAFFFTTFIAFGWAYAVGLIYKEWGSDERRTFSALAVARPLSIRRQSITALGAIMIPVMLLGIDFLMHLWQKDVWQSMEPEIVAMLIAFVVLGAMSAFDIYRQVRRKT